MASSTDSERAANTRDRRVRRVLVVTLVLNLAVAFAKIAVGSLAGVLSVRADGFHSLTDGLNNVVALVGILFAARPPDAGHPYGHRRFELFASLLIGLSLLAMSLDVATDAWRRFSGAGTSPETGPLVFATLVVTLIVNLFVARYEAAVARATGSVLLESDAAHTFSDVLVTATVLVATVLVKSGLVVVDVFAALGVAVFIAVAGVRVLRTTLSSLADAASLDVARVTAIARGVPGVLGAHQVRSRGARGHVFLDLHIELDGSRTLDEAHAITHATMRALKAELDDVVDVTIHTEPLTRDPALHDDHEHGRIDPSARASE